MTKIIISIISVYLLYYAGNIIYDLFLKKDISKHQDETEEYSLNDFLDNNTTEVKEVSIDDVENINTPNSFNKKELSPVRAEDQNENRDLEYWRNKFESENDIDSFNEVTEPQEVQEISTVEQVEKTPTPNSKNQSYYKQFYQFLNLAETSVQVLADRDGYKVYQSLI
ncbi:MULTISPECIES: hypothetical protein [Chryseobacterium]|jgi:hypothetical protein|uniref:Uncharacterized protein n=2 Tax=Chryseobacterium TaxID=59732 RepID=A0A101CE34_9FLAO|nr:MULTISPECIES: hypothetical protein [Chryseobacterium]KUJ54325.1 hypothetical protein AR686_17435 [Chryseobacterium aquaticum subsp. greenlandense]QQV01781.1 hypothetical protein I6I61_11870 [Chryseobacterium sp. FDAARGOS 1104]VFB05008.1 Uncharacterised protein [Chryseobacterium taihuense]